MGGTPDRGPAVLAVTCTVLGISTVVLIMRLVAKFYIVKYRTLDDYLIVLAWFFSVGLSVCIAYATTVGFGQHMADITFQNALRLRRTLYAFTILYNPALMATKSSILIFYLRLFKNTNRVLRIGAYITMAVVNIAGFILTMLTIFQCHPIKYLFDTNHQTRLKCLGIVTLYLASAPVNIITDVAIMLLPIPILTGLRLPQKQKIILLMTFSMGIFVTVVDVIRLYYLQEASFHGTGSATNPGKTAASLDFAWYGSFSFMWTAVEVNVSIACACVPTIKPLIKRLLPRLIYSKIGSSGSRDFTTMSLAPGGTLATSRGESSTLPVDSSTLVSHESDIPSLDFLTVPGSEQSAPKRPAPPTATPSFFDLREPNSMLKLRGKSSFKYCSLVTVTFLIWGFSYGLINSISRQIDEVRAITEAETLGLLTSYFGGYVFGPCLGWYILTRWGFKETFVTGFLVYAMGVIILWPSAVVFSYPGFLISEFVVGSGLATLETAANPFIALCGNPKYAEFRLLSAQGIQAAGTIVSSTLGVDVLFKSSRHQPSLLDLQWAYLVIFFIMVILALIFYYSAIPEAPTRDLEEMTKEMRQTLNISDIESRRVSIATTSLLVGFFAMLCYCGGEGTMSISLDMLLQNYRTYHGPLKLSDFSVSLLAQGLFTIGRFTAAGLSLVVPPRLILLGIVIGAIPTAALMFSLDANTTTLTSITVLYWFFEGPVWPMTYAMALRGQGRHTKAAGALLVVSGSGHSIFTWIAWAINFKYHRSFRENAVVLIAVWGVIGLYPLYLNLYSPARRRQDTLTRPKHPQRRSLDTTSTGTTLIETPKSERRLEIPQTMMRRKSVQFAREDTSDNLEK